MTVVNNFIKIKKEIELISDKTDIIAVSKNFSLDKIAPLIDLVISILVKIELTRQLINGQKY